MYTKAVQTKSNWAFAYEVPMGGYALSISYIGHLPVLDEEAEFATLADLEAEMSRLAPLSEWCDKLFEQLVYKQN